MQNRRKMPIMVGQAGYPVSGSGSGSSRRRSQNHLAPGGFDFSVTIMTWIWGVDGGQEDHDFGSRNTYPRAARDTLCV